MPPYPKRLIEVDLPIKRISAHARRGEVHPPRPHLDAAHLVGAPAFGRLPSKGSDDSAASVIRA
jgi:hypothetical protein